MNNTPVTIEIARANASSVSSAHTIDEAGRIIRDLVGESDATVTVSKTSAPDERIMLAVTGEKFFLGLFRRKEVYQYVASGNEGNLGEQLFTIGGLPTHIKSCYVVDVNTADAVVREWLMAGHEPSSFGQWKLR